MSAVTLFSDAHIPLVWRDAWNNVIICMEESLWNTRVTHCEQCASLQMLQEGMGCLSALSFFLQMLDASLETTNLLWHGNGANN